MGAHRLMRQSLRGLFVPADEAVFVHAGHVLLDEGFEDFTLDVKINDLR